MECELRKATWFVGIILVIIGAGIIIANYFPLLFWISQSQLIQQSLANHSGTAVEQLRRALEITNYWIIATVSMMIIGIVVLIIGLSLIISFLVLRRKRNE